MKAWPSRHAARVALLCGLLLALSAAVFVAVDLELQVGDWRASPIHHVIAAVLFFVAVGGFAGSLAHQIVRRDRQAAGLAESEARYRQLVELCPEAILVHQAGRLILVNEACVRLLGAASSADLLGRDVFELIHPESRASVRKAMAGLLESGRRTPFAERRFVRMDGTVLDVEGTAAVIGDGDRRVIQVILRDVTDRKRVEAELTARTRQQAAVAALGQRALADTDLDVLFDEAVRRIRETLGTEIVVVLELMPDGKDLLLRAGVGWPDHSIGVARIPAAGGSQAGYTLLTEDVVVVEDLRTETRFLKRQVLLDLGAISGLSIVIRGERRPFGVLGAHSKSRRRFSREDVNFMASVAYLLAAAIARSQVEQRLRDQGAWLSGILANTTDGILTIDENGVIESANPEAARLFRRREHELVGKSIATLIAGARHDGAGLPRDFLTPDRPGVAGLARQVEGLHPDGSIFPLEYGVREVSLDGRRLFICTLRDISQRKVTEEQLRQLQKMEAVGQLSGGIAHDFNNLLTVVLGNAELLMDEPGISAPQKRLLDVIRASAERGAGLTRQLLAYSRRQSLRARSFDLNALIGDMDELLSRSLGETIETRTVLAADLWPVMADPSQVESALLNLVVNARDAMPDGGLLVVETANTTLDDDYAARDRTARAGDYVVLAVTDDGSGMDPDVAARAFEPFFTTKEVGKGTGLGLSMVYGFAQQSGGHAKIYSEPGRGTTVRLYLPRAPAAAEGQRPVPAMARPSGGETILVVEDDDLVRH
ncbi:MAG: PAS domain S-box protein, partial [Candidatus Eiseniibacteriota bacterium]